MQSSVFVEGKQLMFRVGNAPSSSKPPIILKVQCSQILISPHLLSNPNHPEDLYSAVSQMAGWAGVPLYIKREPANEFNFVMLLHDLM